MIAAADPVRALLVAAIWAAALTPGGPVAAQTDAAEASTPAPEVASGPQAERLARVVADQFARGALLYVRSLADPTPADYRVSALALEEALALVPRDDDLLRLIIESWHAANDREAELDATRRLVRMDPNDTVAQLRLLSARIAEQQTVEARLALYDRVLSDEGASIDASVRSRLALDDALLSREFGDEDRFVERLTLATQLDPSNKDAADLAATYYLERMDDPLGRVEMLANVVLAEPINRDAHLTLALELLSHGAYEAARRFLDAADRLERAWGVAPWDDRLVTRSIIRWAIEGADPLLNRIEDVMAQGEFAAQEERRAAEQAGEDPESVEPFQPNPRLQAIRVIVASAVEDEYAVENGLEWLTRLTNSDDPEEGEADSEADDGGGIGADALNSALGGEPATDDPPGAAEALSGLDADPGAEEEDALTGLEARARLLWLRLLADRQVEQAAAQLPALRADAEKADQLRPQALRRYQGWLAIRQGEFDRGEALLEPLAEEDIRAALGLAVAAEERMSGADEDEAERWRREATRRYATLARQAPDTLLGVWARTRVQRLIGQPLGRGATVQRLQRYVDSLPREIDELTIDAWRGRDLSIRHVKHRPDHFDRLEVVVQARNSTTIPLGVGPRRVISSRILLSPKVMVGSQALMEDLAPEVVSLQRRLRLKQGETMEARVWASRGRTGLVLDLAALRPATVRWRATSWFGVGEEGRYVPTPFSLITETGLARRPALEELDTEATALVERIRSASGEDLLRALIWARWQSLLVANDLAPQEVEAFRQRVTEAIAARMSTMTTQERAFTASVFPPSIAAEWTAPIDDVLMDSPGRLVWLTRLFQRAAGPLEEQVDMALEADDPLIREIGSIIKARMERRRDAEDADGDLDEADAAADGPSATPAPQK